MKKRVLFVCTHNSARSQLAEGLMNALLGDRYDASSAGTEPGTVNPFAIQALAEVGIDISDHTSKHADQFVDETIDYVVTVCDSANETCPYFPGGKERIHKGFVDPSRTEGGDEAKLKAFINTREEIKKWMLERFS